MRSWSSCAAGYLLFAVIAATPLTAVAKPVGQLYVDGGRTVLVDQGSVIRVGRERVVRAVTALRFPASDNVVRVEILYGIDCRKETVWGQRVRGYLAGGAAVDAGGLLGTKEIIPPDGPTSTHAMLINLFCRGQQRGVPVFNKDWSLAQTEAFVRSIWSQRDEWEKPKSVPPSAARDPVSE